MKNEKYYEFNFWYLYFVIALLYTITILINNEFVLTNSYYYNSLGDQLTNARISDLIAMKEKFQWLTYLIEPIFLLVKISVIAGVIFTGICLSNSDMTYKDCLKIIVLAEFIPFLDFFIKTVFFLISPPKSSTVLQYFSPLSLSQVFDLTKVPKYLIYSIQQINIFEIFYWIFLAFGIKSFTKWQWSKSYKKVLATYGSALFIWILFIMFLSLEIG
jgi:hypothetical protein